MTEDNLEAIRLFNEKTEKLMKSPYVAYITKKNLKVKINSKTGLTTEMPDTYDIDALVVTLRFFIQKRDV